MHADWEGLLLGVLVAVYHAVSYHVVAHLKGATNPEIWEASVAVHGGLAVLLAVTCLNAFVKALFTSKEVPKSPKSPKRVTFLDEELEKDKEL